MWHKGGIKICKETKVKKKGFGLAFIDPRQNKNTENIDKKPKTADSSSDNRQKHFFHSSSLSVAHFTKVERKV